MAGADSPAGLPFYSWRGAGAWKPPAVWRPARSWQPCHSELWREHQPHRRGAALSQGPQLWRVRFGINRSPSWPGQLGCATTETAGDEPVSPVQGTAFHIAAGEKAAGTDGADCSELIDELLPAKHPPSSVAYFRYVAPPAGPAEAAGLRHLASTKQSLLECNG